MGVSNSALIDVPPSANAFIFLYTFIIELSNKLIKVENPFDDSHLTVVIKKSENKRQNSKTFDTRTSQKYGKIFRNSLSESIDFRGRF